MIHFETSPSKPYCFPVFVGSEWPRTCHVWPKSCHHMSTVHHYPWWYVTFCHHASLLREFLSHGLGRVHSFVQLQWGGEYCQVQPQLKPKLNLAEVALNSFSPPTHPHHPPTRRSINLDLKRSQTRAFNLLLNCIWNISRFHLNCI